MSHRVRTSIELATLGVCAISVFWAVVAIPYWFGQAFAYSGTVGRNETEAKAAASLFQCRASIIARVSSIVLLGSFLVRALQLRMAHQRSWRVGLVRSFTEHVVVGLVWWILLVATGAPEPIEKRVASFADHCCD
jgi:hypothetical protein